MKWLDLVMTIVSAAALIGDLVVMYFLTQIGAAISSFASLDVTSIAPVDPTFLQPVVDQFNALLLWGWLFALIVFLTSLYGIWNGWKNIRRK